MRGELGGVGAEEGRVGERGATTLKWAMAFLYEAPRNFSTLKSSGSSPMHKMCIKTRRRSLRPDRSLAPTGPRSGRSKPRAAPGVGHPRPISRASPDCSAKRALVFNVGRRAEGVCHGDGDVLHADEDDGDDGVQQQRDPPVAHPDLKNHAGT